MAVRAGRHAGARFVESEGVCFDWPGRYSGCCGEWRRRFCRSGSACEQAAKVGIEMTAKEALFGSTEQQEQFQQEYAVLIDRLGFFLSTLERIFYRHLNEPYSPADAAFFLLGRKCFNTFLELLLLCGNGKGLGALKSLRSMYEDSVTACFIALNPVEVQDFIDYDYVHHHKILSRGEKEFKAKGFPGLDSERIEKGYERVKDRFRMTLCKKCGTTRPQPSWSKLDVAAMASKIHPEMERHYFPCYLWPTLHSHTTFYSLSHQFGDVVKAGLKNADEPQAADLVVALSFGYGVMLQVATAQNHHFKIGVDSDLERRFRDYDEAWKMVGSRSKSPTGGKE